VLWLWPDGRSTGQTRARVTGADVSAQALARACTRARRYGFLADFQPADAEALPFRDQSFDVVAVHDGCTIWRLRPRDPRNGAVARHGVLILEPARAALTRVAVHLGLARTSKRQEIVCAAARADVAASLQEAGSRG